VALPSGRASTRENEALILKEDQAIHYYIDIDGYFYNIHHSFLINDGAMHLMVLDLMDAGGVQRVSSLVDIQGPVIADYGNR
jgi:hypothetical protein